MTVASLEARPGTRFDIKRYSTQQTIEELQQKLDLAEKTKQSGIIGVKLDGDDAQRIAATLNTLARGCLHLKICVYILSFAL